MTPIPIPIYFLINTFFCLVVLKHRVIIYWKVKLSKCVINTSL